MTKIRDTFQKIIGENNIRSFLYFILAFTGLFLLLTGIVWQTTSYDRYSLVDSSLKESRQNQERLIQIGLNPFDTGHGIGQPGRLNNSNNAGTQPGVGRLDIFKPGMYIILYDADGNVLNSQQDVMAYAASDLKMNRDFLNHIGTTSLNHHTFRTMIVKVADPPDGTGIAYIQLSQNIDQIEEGMLRIQRDIVITMLIFWILSVFVSLYLSRISRRPLERALNRQKTFVSNASHELRTPLSIMQNRLELLFQHPNASILDESENISASLNEVRNMRVLTTNLLNMAKSDGSVQIQPEETGAKFFQDVFENFQLLAEEKGKVFISDLEFEGTALLDQNLIKQMLTIFFDNAVKYTETDGKISISILRQRSELQFVISDNGLGISEKDKKKIFDRFYRVDEARTHGKGGLGLGLSLAREIVHAMKGRIIIEDNQPKGTKFIVKLKV